MVDGKEKGEVGRGALHASDIVGYLTLMESRVV